MNLVVDDAVEVKQATKVDEEKRRELGTTKTYGQYGFGRANRYRPDITQGR